MDVAEYDVSRYAKAGNEVSFVVAIMNGGHCIRLRNQGGLEKHVEWLETRKCEISD